MRFEKKDWWLIAFNFIYILIFSIVYIQRGNYEFLWYILVLVIVAVIILFTLKSSGLSYLTLWLLSIWGLLHMAGGSLMINGHTLYATQLIDIIDNTSISRDFFILKMDQAIHFYGFAVSTLLVYELLKKRVKPKQNINMLLFISVLGSLGLSAINEIVEFIAFLAVAKTGVGDLYNTGFDLIFNLAGTLFAALLIYIKEIRNSK